MSSYPSGTVTFLFTDIEGSTKLAQAYPDAWEALRARHHAILQSAIAAYNGTVFQIIGDAFCVAFHTAPEALKAAIDAQRRLHQEAWTPAPIKIRIGINTGVAQLGDLDDHSGGYIGYATLARVQRVMSIGHGGQILLSFTACELVRGELPTDVTLRDMGEHRLKGLLNPEHLWQVDVPDLPQDFLPLQSLNKIPNNLPVQLTSFIGREKEISEVRQALSVHRLVTLTGSGGAGKTRLSLEVAAEEIDHFSDGVWFIELAPLADPGLIPQTILAVLHLGEQAGKTPLKVLEEQLQSKKLLLILDNCEHLIEGSARVVHTLLVSAPDIKILASSREAMGVQGELAWHVPSLELPDPSIPLQMEQLTQYEAVRLLIDRATLVQPHFTVTNENAPAVAQICHRLDGIPLAIELAAARLKMLSPEQIAARLDDRFRLLTGGSRTALPRQQTLRAMIDWSYELLSEDEKLLLRRLAVFEGGWVLDLAEQICSDDRLESFDILDLLGHLVDKSLLTVHEDKTGRRYRILETVRQYAREKLFETEEVKALRDRHRDVYLALVERIEPEIIRAQQRKWLSVIESELDNLRAAFRWSVENEEGEEALRFCSSLENFWGKNNHKAEATLTSKQALALVKESDPLGGTFWYGATLLAYAVFTANNEWKLFSEAPYLPLFEQAHNIFCSINIYTTTAPVLASSWLADAYIDLNNHSLAERYLLELYEKVKTAEYLWGIAWTKLSMAKLSLSKGDSVSWLALSQEALDLFTQVGDEWVAKNISENLIWQKYLGGEFEDAIMLSNQSIALYQKDDEPQRIALCYDTLGHVALEKGDYETSRSFFTESANIFKALELDGQDILAREKLAYLLHKEGRLQTARIEYQSLLTQVADRTDSFLFGFIHARYALVCLGEKDLGEARKSLETAIHVLKKTAPRDDIFWAYFGLGELARMEKHCTDALKHYRASLRFVNGFLGYAYFPELMNGIAKTECLRSNFDKAAHLMGASEALRLKIGVVIHPVDRSDYDQHIDLLKSTLGAEKFASAWGEGSYMSVEEVYAYAVMELP